VIFKVMARFTIYYLLVASKHLRYTKVYS
jgi:hypothetical protein